MKTILLALISLTLAGCALPSLPPNSLESGSVTITVGPFWSQKLTVAGVTKLADGTQKVGTWEGYTSYLGVVSFTQSFHDLVISPAPAPPK